VLPPVDLELFDGVYWVVDGHNRVAAALYAGQVAIDAAVMELVAPGAPRNPDAISLASQMVDGLAIRAAAGGETASHLLSADLASSLGLAAPSEAEPARPALSEAEAAAPARTEPSRIEPASSEPASSEPASSEPASSEPARTEPSGAAVSALEPPVDR